MQNIDKLMEKYVKASIKYGEAQREGDSITVNRQAAIVRKIREQMKQNSVCGIEKLEPLLKHENELQDAFLAYVEENNN